MKRIYLFLLPFVALFLTACNDMAVSTPELWPARLMIRTAPDGWCDTIPITDTIHVGDTLRWNLMVDGRFNTLQTFDVTADTSVFLFRLEVDGVDSVALAPGTDLEHGKMVFQTAKIYACPVWLRFSPRKTGTHKIQMTIASDAGQNYSPRSWEYTTTIADSIQTVVSDSTSADS